MAAVDNPPKSGVKLKIDSEISRGLSCIVREGKLNGKQVAVKRLHPILLKYEAESRELVQSARLLEQLSHPHIVKIHYLHSQQPPVVYRNLSAKNVLVLMLDDILKLGSSLEAARLPSCGYFDERAPGAIAYMPPEALVGNDIRYNEKSDVFSLGVLMLDIATQYLSLPGISGIGRVPEIDRRAQDLSHLPEDHPLKPIILQCLRDDPGERPDSGAVFRMLSEG